MTKKNIPQSEPDPTPAVDAGTRAEDLIEYLRALGDLVGESDHEHASLKSGTLAYIGILHNEIIEELRDLIFPGERWVGSIGGGAR